MTPTLWARCPCHPDPIHVATRQDPARLEAMGKAIVGQAGGCPWEWVITDNDGARHTKEDHQTAGIGRQVL